ncbi:hypothetical protein BGW36DRAFT_422261 [Talaromyces proteolyticus]|uniref:Uncharacterized protein n=1 Tax=Talaromyces proteolyticus TaxID=1131652 RepID=A0AAD4L5Y7_9EURO|nr:uncharacterized protein BGW36DRAFT_422261 [Talaromyces proteolyticus]KAH8705721.1 hypothetical protein BGW36DRAFT_422261 [Talaromyces proteolyticus]
MHLFTPFPKKTFPLLPFLLYLSTTIVAQPLDDTSSGIGPRGSCLSCIYGSDGDEDCDGLPLNAIQDGPTTDESAGLGFEFETSSIRFQSDHCNYEDTHQAKGKMVNGRSGINWKLTADFLDIGVLSAEYILDGTQIKIGASTAEAAAKAVADDIISWNPFADMTDNKVSITGNLCNPWTIFGGGTAGEVATIQWSPQVTAPMPLQAIYELFGQRTGSILLPKPTHANQNMVMVTKKFFQSNPNGMSSNDIQEDVLGFFSIIMTYAKAADKLDESGPKALMSIMPRTEFSTIFKLVKSRVKGDLYEIVKVLACYKSNENDVDLDSHYCSGTVESPTPNGQMDKQSFTLVMDDKGKQDSASVKDWMDSIQAGISPDRLTEVDEVRNSQVGGLGKALENLLDSSQAAPLFEFRRLAKITASDLSDFASKVESAVIDFHKKYK